MTSVFAVEKKQEEKPTKKVISIDFPDGHNGYKWGTKKSQMDGFIKCIKYPDGDEGCLMKAWKFFGQPAQIVYVFNNEKFYQVIIKFIPPQTKKDIEKFTDSIFKRWGKVNYYDASLFFWLRDGTRIEFYWAENTVYIAHDATVQQLINQKENKK